MARISYDNVERWLDQGIDINGRTLELVGEVNNRMLKKVMKGFHLFGQTEGPITIYLSSGGGDVVAGQAIYSIINKVSASVKIEVYGECCSMAVPILQAAGTRVADSRAIFMIHTGTVDIETALPKDARAYMKISDRQDTINTGILMNRIRERHPEYSLLTLKNMLDKDTWMTAEQALNLGLIDEIV